MKDNIQVDLSNYYEYKPHRFRQLCWRVVNATIFRMLPGRPLKHARNVILRMFGAKIHINNSVFSGATIYAPWNLVMEEHSCIGPDTNIYNKDKVYIGKNVVISQGVFICTAGHDISNPKNPLITAPVFISDGAWVAADSFINMGVTIGEGAVVGARAAVFKDVAPWSVVGGNPAQFIKTRVLTNRKN